MTLAGSPAMSSSLLPANTCAHWDQGRTLAYSFLLWSEPLERDSFVVHTLGSANYFRIADDPEDGQTRQNKGVSQHQLTSDV